MTEVTVTYDHCAGVTLVQVFEQLTHGSLLRSRARVVGLTAGIKSPFIADANRMSIVMMPFYVAVGADHPFRATWLNRSVTTDHVMTWQWAPIIHSGRPGSIVPSRRIT